MFRRILTEVVGGIGLLLVLSALSFVSVAYAESEYPPCGYGEEMKECPSIGKNCVSPGTPCYDVPPYYCECQHQVGCKCYQITP
jgi:hypothetical protein